MRDRGRVRWFNDHFGYGFITDKYGEDVFVHHSVIEGEDGERKTLCANEIVTLSYENIDKRMKATKVTRRKKKG
jgi:cold shock CspA family protein